MWGGDAGGDALESKRPSVSPPPEEDSVRAQPLARLVQLRPSSRGGSAAKAQLPLASAFSVEVAVATASKKKDKKAIAFPLPSHTRTHTHTRRDCLLVTMAIGNGGSKATPPDTPTKASGSCGMFPPLEIS